MKSLGLLVMHLLAPESHTIVNESFSLISALALWGAIKVAAIKWSSTVAWNAAVSSHCREDA